MNEWPVKVFLEHGDGGFKILKVFDAYEGETIWQEGKKSHHYASGQFDGSVLHESKMDVANYVRSCLFVSEEDCQIYMEVY